MTSYPSYRSLHVAWITQLPTHWEATPVKYVCSYNDEVLPETTEPDTIIEYVEISDVDEVNGIKNSELMPFGLAPSRARRLVKDGDVLISTVRTYLRAVAPVTDPPPNMVVSTGFAVIRPEKLVPGFARYALVAGGFVGSVIAQSTGVSYPAINASELVRIPVPIPPAEEQLAIAAYLDHEIARIDALIDVKRSLLGCLGELISTTLDELMSGVDIDAERRLESDNDFHGSIPTGWPVTRLKFLLDGIEQGWSPQTEARPAEDDEWGVLKAGACNGGIFNVDEQKALPADTKPDETLEIQSGDILMSRGSGSVDLVGSVALVKSVRPKLMLPDLLYRLKVGDEAEINKEWLTLALNSQPLRRQIRLALRGAEGLTRKITSTDIKELNVALPPRADQNRIVTAYADAQKRINGLVEHVAGEIGLLVELRTSTITDVVLGRIDVRRHSKCAAQPQRTAA